MSDVPYVGALTALINSPVAMTVNELHYIDVEGEQVLDYVQCVYFTGNKLNHHTGKPDSFIGFGEELAFSSGAFQYAFGLPEGEEEEEEEELEEEEEEEEELEEETDPPVPGAPVQ